MDFSADELLQELARFDLTIALVIGHAARGPDPAIDRLLSGHLRVLRAMLDEDGGTAAADAVHAARRAMEAADPGAPLLMLSMARKALEAMVRRRATTASGLRAA